MSFLTTLKTKFLAPDKIVHGKGSIGVLIGIIAIAFFGYHLGLHPVSIMMLEGGLLAAASVEGTQWYTNKSDKANGLEPRHEVSLLDAFFSTLAPLAMVILIEVLRYFHQLPAWMNVFTSDKLPVWLTL